MMTRIFSAELRDEMLAIVREPAALFFSVLMPVGFFALFATMFGSDGMGIESIATYGAFATLSVIVINPGIGLADARERGWLRVQRASGTPLGITLAAKVAGAVPYAVAVLVAITAVALVLNVIEFTAGTLVAIAVALVLGVLPFSLFSLAAGAKLSPGSATAVLNAALIPTVVASGLWFPLDMMPEFMQRIAVYLPPYHLAQVAVAQIDGGPWIGHAAYLAATTVVGASLAAIAYRSAKP